MAEQGHLATPSCVAFTEVGGDTALNQVALNPSNNLCDEKRLTGQRLDNPIISVWYNGEEKQYTAEQISYMVLGKLCQMAPMTDGVVTVPANRNAMQLCGRMLLRMNEPVAPAIAYCFAKKASLVDGMNILVFGLGGRTISAALLAMEDGILKVKTTDGDSLGGNDFVHRMVSHVAKEFKETNNKDLSGHPGLWARCEEAVKVLSSAYVTTIEVKCLFEGIDLRCSITRDKFEELNVDLFRKCLVPVEKCLKQAGLASSRVQSLVFGCSTKIPRVQHLLQCLLSSAQVVTFINGPGDESFARSAAALSEILSDDSYGAPGIPLYDVTPHSLGLRTDAGVVVLIPKNTPIPVWIDRHFATVFDDQSHVDIHVCRVIGEFEGGGPANPLVGMLSLRNITRAPKGVTTIKVSFAIDSEGVLEVSAEDVTKQGCRCSYKCPLKVERLVAQSSGK